jgi:hypothetical protein
MKKSFFLFLIFIAIVAGYFYYGKPKPPIFRGMEAIQIKPIGTEGAELKADLVFTNPNSMRTQLGKINATISINKTQIAVLQEEFNAGISPQSDYHYPIQIRFEKKEVLPSLDSLAVISIDVSGNAGSSTMFSNYTLPIEFHSTIK